jgi:hypothetical protein
MIAWRTVLSRSGPNWRANVWPYNSKYPQRVPEIRDLAGDPTSLAVVDLRPPDEREQQFIDGEVGDRRSGRLGKSPSVRQPLGHDAVDFGLAGVRPKLRDTKIPSVECDDVLAGGLVVTVRRSTK